MKKTVLKKAGRLEATGWKDYDPAKPPRTIGFQL